MAKDSTSKEEQYTQAGACIFFENGCFLFSDDLPETVLPSGDGVFFADFKQSVASTLDKIGVRSLLWSSSVDETHVLVWKYVLAYACTEILEDSEAVDAWYVNADMWKRPTDNHLS